VDIKPYSMVNIKPYSVAASHIAPPPGTQTYVHARTFAATVPPAGAAGAAAAGVA